MTHGIKAGGAVAVLVAASLLAGCTGSITEGAAVSSTSTARPTSAAGSPGASTTSTTPSNTVTASPGPAASGCPATGGSIPSAAATKQVLDLDGDGRADTIFFSGTTFGVKTASGALFTTNAGAMLTGGGDHHAWAKTMEAEPPVAVVDDGHSAVVFAIVDCKFVVPTGMNGQPYRFTLWGWGKYGTGVACVGGDRGGWMLAGVDAVKTSAGRYRIDTTEVDISKDGRTAENGRTVKGTRTFAADSTEVARAKESICTQVPRLTAVGE